MFVDNERAAVAIATPDAVADTLTQLSKTKKNTKQEEGKEGCFLSRRESSTRDVPADIV